MYLVICITNEYYNKVKIENLLFENENVESFNWIIGTDAKKTSENINPIIGGSLRGLFQNSESEIALIEIKTKSALNNIVQKIKENESGHSIKLIILPVMKI